jgi:hypothetical protein
MLEQIIIYLICVLLTTKRMLSSNLVLCERKSSILLLISNFIRGRSISHIVSFLTSIYRAYTGIMSDFSPGVRQWYRMYAVVQRLNVWIKEEASVGEL